MNKEKKVYTYFVSYQWKSNLKNSKGVGCCTVEKDRKIKNANDLKDLHNYIENLIGYTAVILNFILL